MYEPFNLKIVFKQFHKNHPIYKKRIFLDKFQYPKINFLNQAINLCESYGNFLDVGAGNGELSFLLLKKGFKHGTGVEVINNPNLNKLEEYNNFSVFNGLIQDFKTEEKFDFILMSEVFEHFPPEDLKEIILNLTNLLKPGGIVYLNTPNPLNVGPASISKIYYKHCKYGHYKHYTKREIVNLFEDNFELIGHQFNELSSNIKWQEKGMSIKRRTKNFPNIFIAFIEIIASPFFFIFLYYEKIKSPFFYLFRSQGFIFRKMLN